MQGDTTGTWQAQNGILGSESEPSPNLQEGMGGGSCHEQKPLLCGVPLTHLALARLSGARTPGADWQVAPGPPKLRGSSEHMLSQRAPVQEARSGGDELEKPSCDKGP